MDQAIANLRELFHLPAERNLKVPNPESRDSSGDTPAAIRSALARGPLSPRALADAVGLSVAGLRPHLRAMDAEGITVSTGTTANRRIALAPAAAKEAL